MRLFFVKTAGLLGLLMLVRLAANGQIVNIEQGRVKQDTASSFGGRLGADFSLYNQNAGKNRPNNYLKFTLNSDFTYNSGKHTYLLLNYFNYLLVNYTDKAQRNTIAKQGYSHARVNLYRDRRLSYELFAQGQIEKARGLEWRSLEGGYLRFRLMRNYRNVNIYLGTGLMHEHEEWRHPEIENDLIVSDMLKTTNYVSAKMKLQGNVEANAIVYYQTGYSKEIDDFRNRVSGDISLNLKLYKALAFRANFNCSYENEPVVPVTKFVYTLQNGIALVF